MAGMELATAYVSIVPTTKGLQGKIQDEIVGPLGNAGGVAGQRAGRSFGDKMKTAAKVGATALAGGLAVLFKVGVEEQSDFLKGQAQLESAVKSTGGAAGASVQHMEDLAGSIQGMSGQTDDSIVAAQGLLLGFTNIKNVGADKIFDQTTLAAANMAARLGGDASVQAKILGKALNDPVKGMVGLRRAGVTFTEAQKKQVAAMVKTGNTLGAQKVILAGVEARYGGAAKAAGQTLPGQMARAKRSFEDIAQSVIAGIMPVLQKLADVLTKYVLPAFKKTVEFFQSGSTASKVLMGVLGGLAATLALAAIATKVHAGAMIIANVATKIWAAGQWLLNAALNANPIGLIVAAIGLLVAAVVWIATKTTWFQTIWRAAWGFIKGAFNAVFGFIKRNWPLILAILTGPVGLAVLWIVNHFQAIKNAFSAVISSIGRAVGRIGGFFASAYNSVKGWIGNIVGFIGGLPGKIIGMAGQMASAGLRFASALWSGIKSGLAGAVRGVGDALGWIGQAVKNGINTVLHLPWNIPQITIPMPGPVPDIHFGPYNLIGRLAKGGLTDGPMMAMVGDNPSGREAVLPLDSPKTAKLLSAVFDGGRTGGGARSMTASGRLELSADSQGNLAAWVRDLVLRETQFAEAR